MERERLDQRLVREGRFPSREAAQRAIMAGRVRVQGLVLAKAGTPVSPDAEITVATPDTEWASRGGIKLAFALDCWPIVVAGREALDVGASTGGFTDVLLQRGAKRVHAIDVGYGQFAWRLRQDPRVIVLERTNVRHLDPQELYQVTRPATLATIDVSFIGLAKVLPAVARLLTCEAGEGADIVALVKPQFEAGRQDVGKRGVVKDPAVHERVVAEVVVAAQALGMEVKGRLQSPITGPAGNVEFLLWLVMR